MLRNFFKTAGRNILKYKAYSVINFVGLTAGLALALLILAYVRSEVSFDRFHEKHDRVYRLKYVAPNDFQLAQTPPPIAPRMKEFFPEVEEAARLYGRNISIAVPNENRAFEESRVYFADAAIMDIFTFEFVRGDKQRALTDEFTVIITEEMATKYFGEDDPIGASLTFGGKHAFKVTGVVRAFPEHSHLRFNMLVPYENMYDMESDRAAQLLRQNLSVNFVISHSYTYVLLKPGADPSGVNEKFAAFVEKYALPQLQMGQVFSLMPLTDIHLESTLLAEPSPTNSWSNLLIFIGVGILTLVIACINYVNLSTAQSLTRVREIGIRKVLGSLKSQLVAQFLAESFLFGLLALMLAFGVFYAALPVLNTLTNKTLTFAGTVDATMIGASALLLVAITLMAGGYPAWFVTRFNSINALKGSGGRYGRPLMRRVLVVFQLMIACMLLSGALLIVKQLDYIATRPLGFQKDQIINVPLFSANLNGIFRQNDSTFRTRLKTFRDVIEGQSAVQSTALSSNPPGLGAVFRQTIPEGWDAEDNLFCANISVDYDFIETFGMELVAGRGFSEAHGTDPAEGFIVNETAVREFNWGTPEEAIGKTLNREGKEGKVIGIIHDFNFTSLTTPVASMVLEMNPNQYNTLSIRFTNADVQPTLELLEREWQAMFPEKAFEYSFLDEQLDNLYRNFQNFSTIIQAFTIIAILISCLGVYGLVLFVVQRKVKEIGVRKVLGAGVPSILRLIYMDFTWLLIIGFVLAIPASYAILDQWLENFTYRTTIDALTYVSSFAMVLVVVALTIGYHAVKASLANPVTSLRSE